MDHVEIAKKIIEENNYMVLSTASLDGTPWVSPVFYSYDRDFNLYWVSYRKAHHSELVRANPQASIVIYNSQHPEGEGDAVYFQCRVDELEDEKDIEKASTIMNKRMKMKEFKIKKIEDVSGTGIWRIYKATPKSVSKLTKGEYINGQLVDKRIEISLA